MKRRNLLHTGIAAVLLLSTGACEDFKFGNAFLDKPFTTDITIDTVYAHKVYAEQALAEVYRSLPDYLPSGGRLCWGILEGMTDLGDAIKPNGIRSYYTGNVSSSTGDTRPYTVRSAGQVPHCIGRSDRRTPFHQYFRSIVFSPPRSDLPILPCSPYQFASFPWTKAFLLL